MSVRKLLLFLGIVLVLAGLGMSFVWLNRVTTQAPQVAEPARKVPALLTALHPIPAGTLLRDSDFGWKEVAQGDARPGQLLRGEVSEAEFLGALTRRDFAEGEVLTAGDLVKPTDRRFLSAVLRPGKRAVSIQVDAPNSASGLVLPGDFVDVMLTQNFGDNTATSANRSVGETVLHDVRVVAVEQSIGDKAKPATPSGPTNAEPRIPKTVSLELNERDAQALVVARELGKVHLAVRSLEGSGMERTDKQPYPGPVWAYDVSQAVAVLANLEVRKREIAKREAQQKEAEKKEAEKREAEKREAEKREAEKREAAEREAKKREAQQKETEKKEAEKREAEKREAEKREAEKREVAEREAERREAAKRAASCASLKRSAGDIMGNAVRCPPFAPPGTEAGES